MIEYISKSNLKESKYFNRKAPKNQGNYPPTPPRRRLCLCYSGMQYTDDVKLTHLIRIFKQIYLW